MTGKDLKQMFSKYAMKDTPSPDPSHKVDGTKEGTPKAEGQSPATILSLLEEARKSALTKDVQKVAAEKGKPKKDGSGKGKRANKGRGGCSKEEQKKKSLEKLSAGKETPTPNADAKTAKKVDAKEVKGGGTDKKVDGKDKDDVTGGGDQTTKMSKAASLGYTDGYMYKAAATPEQVDKIVKAPTSLANSEVTLDPVAQPAPRQAALSNALTGFSPNVTQRDTSESLAPQETVPITSRTGSDINVEGTDKVVPTSAAASNVSAGQKARMNLAGGLGLNRPAAAESQAGIQAGKAAATPTQITKMEARNTGPTSVEGLGDSNPQVEQIAPRNEVQKYAYAEGYFYKSPIKQAITKLAADIEVDEKNILDLEPDEEYKGEDLESGATPGAESKKDKALVQNLSDSFTPTTEEEEDEEMDKRAYLEGDLNKEAVSFSAFMRSVPKSKGIFNALKTRSPQSHNRMVRMLNHFLGISDADERLMGKALGLSKFTRNPTSKLTAGGKMNREYYANLIKRIRGDHKAARDAVGRGWITQESMDLRTPGLPSTLESKSRDVLAKLLKDVRSKPAHTPNWQKYIG